jgi:hypothetical protein
MPAIGNMRVNARGDLLGAGGKIVKKREEIVSEYYNAPAKAPEKTVNVAPTPLAAPTATITTSKKSQEIE